MPNGKQPVLDGKKLTDEQLGKLYRKLREIEKRINEGVISFSETLDVLQRIIIEGKSSHHLSVISGESEIKYIDHLIDTDATPFIPDGWSVEKHAGHGLWKWNHSSVQLFLSKEQTQSYAFGNDIQKVIEKQKGKIILNANVLDYLLAHPELIPEAWKGKAVFFWGTIYRISDGILCVRFLNWRGDWLRWSSSWLGDNFDAVSPAALAS